jgi:hypothetical protein
MTGNVLNGSRDLPNIAIPELRIPNQGILEGVAVSTHKPRMLLLYGSLRERSFSRFLTLEAQRLLEVFGCETRIFNPRGLPLPDSEPDSHPKVQELRELAAWSGSERHGAISGCEVADRLILVDRRRSTDAGQDPGDHAGLRRIAVIQCRQSHAGAWPLDAHVHDSEPVLGGQGLSGI